jgi:hypothetical protein
MNELKRMDRAGLQVLEFLQAAKAEIYQGDGDGDGRGRKKRSLVACFVRFQSLGRAVSSPGSFSLMFGILVHFQTRLVLLGTRKRFSRPGARRKNIIYIVITNRVLIHICRPSSQHDLTSYI